MTSYHWSYAPTNRAGCKGKCKEKIPKGAVRFGVSAEAGDHDMTQFRCLDCVTDKQISNVISGVGGLEKIDGFDVLTPEDQARVLAKAGKAPVPAAAKAAAKAEGKAAAKAAAPAPARTAAASKAAPSEAIQHGFLDQAKQYDFIEVRALVETWKDQIVNAQPAGRWSALHQFASAGHSEAVEYLIAQGADPHAKAKDGTTPADVAKAEVAHLLIAKPSRASSSSTKEEDEAAPASPPPPAAASAASPAKRKATEVAAGSPAKKAAKTGRPVDSGVPGRDDYSVVDEWSVLLNQTNVGANNNKYYKIQILQKTDGEVQHFCWTHWGRVGASGQHKLDPCGSMSHAEALFKKKFRDKSGVPYASATAHDWTPTVGMYTLVETEEQEGAEGGGDAPLGKLTAKQIEKGQGVLQKIEEKLPAGAGGPALKQLQDLTSAYYTLVPHDFGFALPPTISTSEMLEAEQELLKFYLRMGFEEMDKVDDGLTPVSGIMDLELPVSLEAACGGICKSGDVRASSAKAAALSKKQSGAPTTAMQAHLYGAILLYTSNAIYKELNLVLRSEDREKIRKYFKYLRLLLEALGRLPQQQQDFWRGVSVDLFDQYPVGSTVTWWGVSSCTSDIKVANKFMKGCGGKCTLLTINAKTAADISELSFYGNEKESLLAPGTQFTVKKASRAGNITDITLQEIGRVLG